MTRRTIGDVRPQRLDLGRYRRILGSSRVWLLAPTWIALNAVLGSWTTQSVFQLVREPPPHFENQLLMQGISPTSVSIAFVAVGSVFVAGLWYWGNRFKRYRRTSIIAHRPGGRAGHAGRRPGAQPFGGLADADPAGLVVVAGIGLFVMSGATPAALGLLADITESYPADRGAIMGLYSVFLGVGQILGAWSAAPPATWPASTACSSPAAC